MLLAGEGPSFCAGADVDWMRASVDLDFDANLYLADANALRGMLEAVDRCPAPVIAQCRATHSAAAPGLWPAQTSRSPAESAVFAFSEVKLGIIPAVISPFALAKIGTSAARRYFVAGERFDAATALRIGLVRVAADLDAAVERVLAELWNARPEGGTAREEARAGAARWPRTARRIAERRTSDEGQEGLKAFLERRSPESLSTRTSGSTTSPADASRKTAPRPA